MEKGKRVVVFVYENFITWTMPLESVTIEVMQDMINDGFEILEYREEVK